MDEHILFIRKCVCAIVSIALLAGEAVVVLDGGGVQDKCDIFVQYILSVLMARCLKLHFYMLSVATVARCTITCKPDPFDVDRPIIISVGVARIWVGSIVSNRS